MPAVSINDDRPGFKHKPMLEHSSIPSHEHVNE